MPATAVVGANWGDEGKGKMTDYFAKNSDIVVRFQGGNNAGHTIINEYGKFALHLLPSGVFYPHVKNVLGPGVALNIQSFLKEIQSLRDRGVPEPSIAVSDRVKIVMPYHVLFDGLEESRLKEEKFGSTRSGIAPFYSDKSAKIAVEASMLFDKKILFSTLKKALDRKNILLEHLYGEEKLDPEKLMEETFSLGERIKPYLADTTSLLKNALREKKKILLEGQLGSLRDPDHGIYPFSTSSSPLAGFAPVGAGIPPYEIKEIIAVVKAYSTCVGSGPFVAEIFGERADELRKRGGDSGEYGATTGRPRRMGWFDCVATRYGCAVQGATQVALTNLDVLGYLEKIPVCVGYKTDRGETDRFLTTPFLERAKPILKEFKGWKTDISSVRKFEDLPKEARDYVDMIESQIEVRISWVSVGPKRADLIERDSARIFS